MQIVSVIFGFYSDGRLFGLLYEGSGGYGYLLEPLWWIGMITSTFLQYLDYLTFYISCHFNRTMRKVKSLSLFIFFFKILQ